MNERETNETFEIGASPKRLEDERLLRGEGRYLDDIEVANALHGVVVRSPWAHARIIGLDAAPARGAAGVHLVLTGQDIVDAGLGPTLPHALANVQTGEPFVFEPQPLLAVERVRYAGEAVAFVVAETRALAMDASELIEIDYEPLPAVLSPAEAIAPQAPQLSDNVPENTCLDWSYGDVAGTERCFARADHVVSLSVHNHRVAHNAMEPRSAIASYLPDEQRYDLLVSTQNVHVIRDHIADALGVDRERVRLRAPDVGGGFGVRNFVYGEYVLSAWAAKETERPVKWVNTRADGFISDHQARDFDGVGELAISSEGRFLGLRLRSRFNLGAYLIGAGGGVPTGQFCTCPGSVYDIESVHLDIVAALTNTVPIGVTRGPGFAEMVDVMERLIDRAARQTGIDRIALRRLNLVSSASMPWTNATGNVIDSGDFPRCLEAALEAADYAGFEGRRAEANANGMLRGIGIASHVKATGGLDEENIEFRFEADELWLITGTQAIGQGHETTFRQIAASLLGVAPERIRYVAGDSDAIAMGGGHGSSRATYMASSAMSMARERMIEKALPVASDMLEVNREDIEYNDGDFKVVGTDRSVSWFEVAREAAASGRSIDTYQHFRRAAMTYPSGCHVAEIEVDPETGRPALVRYTAVDDYGVVINPMVAEGQAHGAIAQGVGQALLEEVVFEPSTGQLLSGSFMDYALPRADDLPAFDLFHEPTRCTTNPLGVKGCGEAGAIAGYPAVANAIADAMSHLDSIELTGAASPYRLWRSLR